eukprot:13616963-Ditylum_brightwellii.AAC.1
MKFRGVQTIKSASIATDHLGNEQAVNIYKVFSFLKCDIQCSSNMSRVNGTWLAWSFQANFM